ncbi:MAG TPA: pyridoxamine 5'-phosphate oxidase [Hyphomicrobiaceae bacterium]|nr:pyridoxamine 5'-phosphate oxidase [Hyphomicrobiaceae bacterium]
MRADNSDAERPAADFAHSQDPFALFETWFAEAAAHEPSDPNAMTLATVDSAGLPNSRVVLLKGLDAADHAARGFVFYTNFESVKGRELIACKAAALNFHWKSLRRQVRIRGTVGVVTDAEADAYFASRPRGSRIGAWASQQSRPLESRFALEKAVAAVTARYLVGEIPRPPYWSGFRVTPVEIEFWHERPFRLHERVAFRREAEGGWRKALLYP